MLALPIARRELLVLSRAATTWRRRVGASAVVFCIGLVFALLYRYAGQVALNQAMSMLGAGLSFMCLFAGVSLTGDSIAEEKRSGTLGLLFLTNLTPFEIVLGKLIAHAVLGFYAVFCALPLLSMGMIFGGTRLVDVLMYLVLALNVLFFSAAVGLFASSVSWRQKRAAALGTLIIVFLWMGLPLLGLIFSASGAPAWLVGITRRFSLDLTGGAFMGTAFASNSMGWNLLWVQILGWTFVGLAVWLLPRRWHDTPPSGRSTLRDVWKNISLGRPAVRLKLRRALLDRNPFMWLASRERLQTALLWIISLSVIVFIGSAFFRGRFQPESLIVTAMVLSIVQQLIFSGAAGAQLVREYEQGTLEMVLSTPLSVNEVIRGQLAASLRQYRKPFALTFLVLWAGIVLVFAVRLREWLAFAALAIYSGLFLLQFYTLGWVGMWSVMKVPEPKRAHANAFFLVTILHGLMFGLIIVLAQFLYWLVRKPFSPGPEILLPLFFVLAFTNCIYWLRRAKRELPGELRLFAFRRYSPQEALTLFGRLGRLLGRQFARKRLGLRQPPAAFG